MKFDIRGSDTSGIIFLDNGIEFVSLPNGLVNLQKKMKLIYEGLSLILVFYMLYILIFSEFLASSIIAGIITIVLIYLYIRTRSKYSQLTKKENFHPKVNYKYNIKNSQNNSDSINKDDPIIKFGTLILTNKAGQIKINQLKKMRPEGRSINHLKSLGQNENVKILHDYEGEELSYLVGLTLNNRYLPIMIHEETLYAKPLSIWENLGYAEKLNLCYNLRKFDEFNESHPNYWNDLIIDGDLLLAFNYYTRYSKSGRYLTATKSK